MHRIPQTKVQCGWRCVLSLNNSGDNRIEPEANYTVQWDGPNISNCGDVGQRRWGRSTAFAKRFRQGEWNVIKQERPKQNEVCTEKIIHNVFFTNGLQPPSTTAVECGILQLWYYPECFANQFWWPPHFSSFSGIAKCRIQSVGHFFSSTNRNPSVMRY